MKSRKLLKKVNTFLEDICNNAGSIITDDQFEESFALSQKIKDKLSKSK